jgi:hypothetical protein
MRQSTFNLCVLSFILLLASTSSDALAQRRYRHVKKARTEEGFVRKTKAAEKKNTENEPVIPIGETYTAEPLVKSPEPLNTEVKETFFSLETASADNALTATPGKSTKRIKSIVEKSDIGRTERQLFSNEALRNSGLNKMEHPENTQARPGLAFIIMGAVFLGVGFIFLISSIVLLGLGSVLGFIALLILSIMLLGLGASFLPIGIVKLIKYKRGK